MFKFKAAKVLACKGEGIANVYVPLIEDTLFFEAVEVKTITVVLNTCILRELSGIKNRTHEFEKRYELGRW